MDIFAVDIDPDTGTENPRLLGTVLPEAGPPAGKGNKGRFRFEIGKGNFLPATRTYQIRSRHGVIDLPPQSGRDNTQITGLKSGQYHFPQFGYQFTDTLRASPLSRLTSTSSNSWSMARVGIRVLVGLFHSRQVHLNELLTSNRAPRSLGEGGAHLPRQRELLIILTSEPETGTDKEQRHVDKPEMAPGSRSLRG